MASKYDDLDASTELEQELAADLALALNGRGCKVIHNGTNSGGRHAPGGKADIEIHDPANKRLILVEVTRRKSSSADGEFLAVTDHLDKAIARGGYEDYGLLYVSPATSARLSSNFRDLWNRSRERDGRKGRIVALDFAATEMLLTKLAAAPSELYPASRFGALFEHWAEATDDSMARLLVQRTILTEDLKLGVELEQEVEEFAAERERRLKKQLERIEDDLRDRGVVGDDANRVLIFLTFIRLYEERRQGLTTAKSRFTVEGFETWQAAQPAAVRNKYGDRMVEALLHEIAEDADLQAAGLLRDAQGNKLSIHPRVADSFVKTKLLPVFDEYDFRAGQGVDILGAVFETLARRGEKDTRVGQFFTPQPVVDFCAEMVPLTCRDLVLDPAVGTARFLIKSMGLMLERVPDVGAAREAERRTVRTERLLGTDIGSWVATIAKMNMYIHGDGKTNIKEANGLALGNRKCFDLFPNGLSGQVDVVLTNPPLGETSHVVAVEHWLAMGDAEDPNLLLDRLGVVPMRVKEEQDLAHWGRLLAESETDVALLEALLPNEAAQKRLRQVRRTRSLRETRVAQLRADIAAGNVQRGPANESMKGGALFLGAIADYLKPVRDPNALPEWRGGWAAVVVDEAILNTPDYGTTREFIRKHFYVKAVVSLGRQGFKYLAHTDAKTSVLFLVRKPELGKAPFEPTFYAHAERVGYGPTGEWVGDDLPQVKLSFDTMRDAVREQYKDAWLDQAAAQAAAEQVPGFGHAFYAMGDLGGSNRLDFFNARYLQRTREMEAKFAKLGRLGDYIEMVPIENPVANRRGEYNFAEVSRTTGTIRSKGPLTVDYGPTDLWIVRDGYLVVSGIDAVHGSVAVAGPEVDGLVMSLEMYGYRRKEGVAVSLTYLALLLRTQDAVELLEGMTTGTSNRTRLESPEQLLELPVPTLPPLNEQERVAAIFTSSVAARQSASEQQAEAETAVSEVWPVEQGAAEHSGLVKTAALMGKLLRVPKDEADEVHGGH